jgi:hypothetical protein
MLYKEDKIKIRPRYFKMLKAIGWKVTYDDNKDMDNKLLDISVFLTKSYIDQETKKKTTKYGFFQTSYNSDVSYTAFDEAWKNSNDGSLKKLGDTIHARIYPFDLDDVVAQLLHLGYHIQDVYKVDSKGKLNIFLNPESIHKLIHQFCTQNSPLLDPATAPRPKKIGQRKPFTWINPEAQSFIKEYEAKKGN